MVKASFALAGVAVIGLTAAAFAEDGRANPNGSDAKPTSSTAATPANKKHSPGTVGAMKDAGGGSFKASDKDKKDVHLK